MQLEDLQKQWMSLDRKVNRTIALESELVKRMIMQPARRRVNRLAFWPAIDVAFCAAALLATGSFVADFGGDWRLALPGVCVMLGAIALLGDSVHQLQRIAELDWTGPVASLQGALDKLRIMKIRQFKWVMLLCPAVGFCGFVVAAHALLHWASGGQFSAIDRISPRWIIANYIACALAAPIGFVAVRTLAGRCSQRSWWKPVLDDISGKSLQAATRDVDAWASLQRETAMDTAGDGAAGHG